MIAKCPEFSKLTIEHKDEVYKYTHKFQPYSDFNFTSLFCWNTDESTEIADLNGNLVIKLPDYITGETVYSLIGETKIDESLVELLSLSPTLHLVPEIVVKSMQNPSGFLIQEDRDQFDYIYSLSSLASLEGSEFKNKRKRINRFLASYYESMDIKKVNLNNSTDLEELNKNFAEWAVSRNKDEDDTKNEKKALNRLLTNASSLRLTGTKIYMNNKCIGFSINEIVSEDFAVCHFQKALLSYEYIDIFLSNLIAKELIHFDCKYINWEQDLGIPGLRELKQSYMPEFLLKKYTIRKA